MLYIQKIKELASRSDTGYKSEKNRHQTFRDFEWPGGAVAARCLAEQGFIYCGK